MASAWLSLGAFEADALDDVGVFMTVPLSGLLEVVEERVAGSMFGWAPGV